jgi:hypothetical protein
MVVLLEVSSISTEELWSSVRVNMVLALTCTVNCGTLYRQNPPLTDHVHSIEFTTGQVDSSCRNISRMINGNRIHLSSILCLIAKGLNTYVNKLCCLKVLFYFKFF